MAAAAAPAEGGTTEGHTTGSAPAPSQPRPHRPRRFRRPRATGERAPGEQTGSEPGASARAPGDRGPRPRGPRRPREDRPREGAPRDGTPRERPPGDRPPREARARDERGRGKGRPDRDRRGPKRGKFGGGEAPREKPERKLYTVESVVDRGFEDVAGEGEGAETRRVHWTIVKRTVADQRSTRLVSAVYLLQREGGDAEFANLALARAAVNKTIVHPEKLTKSKEEYAAAKKK